MLIKFTILCTYLFITGYILTWLLFRHKKKRLIGSEIQTKIHYWVPIFISIIILAFSPTFLRHIILTLIIIKILHEYISFNKNNKISFQPLVHLSLVILGVASATYVVGIDKWLFLSVWIMSVVSDVTAFFMGSYIGRYSLPKQFNHNKKWEGVAGQLIGAGIGYCLLELFIVKNPTYLFFTVGFGAAIGDIANSYVKRMLKIKDWGRTIPGHGGFLDRFSSFSYALFFTSVLTILN